MAMAIAIPILILLLSILGLVFSVYDGTNPKAHYVFIDKNNVPHVFLNRGYKKEYTLISGPHQSYQQARIVANYHISSLKVKNA